MARSNPFRLSVKNVYAYHKQREDNRLFFPFVHRLWQLNTFTGGWKEFECATAYSVFWIRVEREMM